MGNKKDDKKAIEKNKSQEIKNSNSKTFAESENEKRTTKNKICKDNDNRILI